MSSRSHLSEGAGFVQWKRAGWDYLGEMIALSPAAARLWCFLAKRADKRNAVRASISEMVEEVGVSRASVFRALELLEYNRWAGRDSGGSIHLNASLTWRNKQECIGMAQILETVTHVRSLPAKAVKADKLRKEAVS